MTEEHQNFVVDLSNCSREPIHIPGAIQPHGVLFALAEPQLSVTQVSESVRDWLGVEPEAILGQSLERIFAPEPVHQIRETLAHDACNERYPLRTEVEGRAFDLIVHRYDGVAVLEVEPVAAPPLDHGSRDPLRDALTAMQNANSAPQLCDVVVREVKRTTGFERVIMYRFDRDDHGEVIAETVDEPYESYLGLHYPESDIPKQARDLYLKSWLRNIPDAKYSPSPIVPPLRADVGKPLDLSLSVLRSVSPIHLEYLHNIGIRAAMSVSVIVGNRLWGLISCAQHSGPHYVPYEIRAAAETIGRLLSLQLAAFAEREAGLRRTARQPMLSVLSAAMRNDDEHPSLLVSLLKRPNELLALMDASGAAVVENGAVHTCGNAPSPELVRQLCTWLDPELTPYWSAALAKDIAPELRPAVLAEKDSASGLASFALPGPQRRLFWFRPEMVHTVNWGGNPSKPAQADTSLRLHPRRSFELWKQEVHLQAHPWTESDQEALEDLRRTAVEIDLARQVIRERKAVHVRDDLVAVVSHDLRNPLGVIQMQAAWLLHSATEAKSGDPFSLMRESAERIQRSVDRMNALINDLLDLAKIEAGRFDLRCQMENVTDMVHDTLIIIRPLADAKHITLTENIESVRLNADRERFFQVLSNLLGNAIKFTPESGTIALCAKQREHDILFTVSDTGKGIPAEQLPHLFERYWQARGTARQGSGLGLFIAKGIVEAHGGRIWAESEPGAGARFFFTLPLQPVVQ